MDDAPTRGDTDPPARHDRDAYPVGEAAARLGISRAGLYRLLYSGQITARKIGARTVILRAEIDRYLEQLPTAQIGPGPTTSAARPAVGQ